MEGPNVPLMLLSLDGGGIRGLSELIILREIMQRMDSQGAGPMSSRPRDYFDMIGGTGTGGWIAIMLGRLGMTIQEAISAYSNIVQKVFSETRTFSRDGLYKVSALEDTLKDMIRCELGDEGFRMMDVETERLSCKTFVCAQSAGNLSVGPPEVFRTYETPRGRSSNCYIWEAARATSANPRFFKRARINDGETMHEYLDSGLVANNPTRVLLAEAGALFPNRSVGCIVSLGAGHPATISVPEASTFARRLSLKAHSLQTAASTVLAIADNCEIEAEWITRCFKDKPGIYHRFSVVQGRQEIGRAEAEEIDVVSAYTLQYLKLEGIAKALDNTAKAIQSPVPKMKISELANDILTVSENALVAVPTGSQEIHSAPAVKPVVPPTETRPPTTPSWEQLSQHPGHALVPGSFRLISREELAGYLNSLSSVPIYYLGHYRTGPAQLKPTPPPAQAPAPAPSPSSVPSSSSPSSAPPGKQNKTPADTELSAIQSPPPIPLLSTRPTIDTKSTIHPSTLSRIQTSLSEWVQRNRSTRSSLISFPPLYSSPTRTSGAPPVPTNSRPVYEAPPRPLHLRTLSEGSSSVFPLHENVTRFLSPNVTALRDSVKYQVEQQVSELSFNPEGTLQVVTKLIRDYPIYPMLIATAFSHISWCLRDESMIEQLKYDLDSLARRNPTALLWLTNHADIKTRLVNLINIKPRNADCEHWCLLTCVQDWRTITQADIICLGVQVAVVLQDHSQAREFLEQRNDSAQTLLDLLQALLSYSNIDSTMKRMFLYALIKLASKSGHFPQCLNLRNLTWQREPFASGGFGDIYKGNVRSKSNVPLAIKVVRAYQRSERERLLKSFSSEAVVWSHLRHPNVVPFYGVFHQGDTILCLVSPYMEKGNVRSYLRTNPTGINRSLMALDVARGLEYLHGHDPTIVHTDVKGVNILVSNSGRACLADFGFATAKDTHQAHVQSTMPTALSVGWTAPEVLERFGQAGHQAHTTKSDMYAFGCVCYEIFCDRDPFHGVNSMMAVFHQVTVEGKHPERPRGDEAPLLKDGMWEFMRQCWIRDSGQRPSAQDAVQFLEHAAGRASSSRARSDDEWDYSVLEEILAETVHPFSLLLSADDRNTGDGRDVRGGPRSVVSEQQYKPAYISDLPSTLT